MARAIRIWTRSTGYVQAELSEERSPKTAEAVWKALPIKGRANRWGDEIYFSIPVKVGEEKGQEVVERGDLGYWPPGNAFCIFFGRTPASQGDEIRAASPVNVFGRVTGNPEAFKAVKNGEEIRIEKAE
ncbi:MAG: cyclophilin-like fold protein [Candidatus Bathyarchaeia archaeon]